MSNRYANFHIYWNCFFFFSNFSNCFVLRIFFLLFSSKIFFVCLIEVRVSLCSLICPGTHYVDQIVLQFIGIPLPLSLPGSKGLCQHACLHCLFNLWFIPELLWRQSSTCCEMSFSISFSSRTSFLFKSSLVCMMCAHVLVCVLMYV